MFIEETRGSDVDLGIDDGRLSIWHDPFSEMPNKTQCSPRKSIPCNIRTDSTDMIVNSLHEDVIKWKHFPRYWPFVLGIHRSPVNSPHKGQWPGALMFSLICARINGRVNNGEVGDLKCHRAHYDVIVMRRSGRFGIGKHNKLMLLIPPGSIKNCFFYWNEWHLRALINYHLHSKMCDKSINHPQNLTATDVEFWNG